MPDTDNKTEKAKVVFNSGRRINLATGFIHVFQMFTKGENANPATFRVDVSKIERDTAMALLLFAIKEKANNATCNPKAKTRADKIAEVDRVLESIENNTLNERSSGYTDWQETAIALYIQKALGGKTPKGGKATVIKLIGELPEERADKFKSMVDATMELAF